MVCFSFTTFEGPTFVYNSGKQYYVNEKNSNEIINISDCPKVNNQLSSILGHNSKPYIDYTVKDIGYIGSSRGGRKKRRASKKKSSRRRRRRTSKK